MAEFGEFSNVEGRDYDIYSNDGNIAEENNRNQNLWSNELVELIGIIDEDEIPFLQERYNITEEEYLNPNEETIRKVKEALGVSRHF
jgi:hypothetical protein